MSPIPTELVTQLLKTIIASDDFVCIELPHILQMTYYFHKGKNENKTEKMSFQINGFSRY